MKESVIIVAGGTGTRMKSSMPKQFLELAGKPVIVHTIDKFIEYNPLITICVVVHEDYLVHWSVLQSEHYPTQKILTCTGGKTRFHSVKNGLEILPESDVIGVHDAARPLVDVKVIKQCFLTAREKRAVVPVLPVHESLRKTHDGFSVHVNRAEFRIVQTPQCFNGVFLKTAYQQEFSEEFTDDASVVEASGVSISMVDGNKENIKITEPADLRIAEGLLSSW
ncbi:MAG: 2-C-methyl-D-erythritol 4-phosphate cytidylyltransferase [Flavobacteriales bacterium]